MDTYSYPHFFLFAATSSGVGIGLSGRVGTNLGCPTILALSSISSLKISGTRSFSKIASHGHSGTQALQSMHSSGSINNISFGIVGSSRSEERRVGKEWRDL